MLILFILLQAAFLALLFYYQRRDKIYVGYTTVLSLLFGSLLLSAVLVGLCPHLVKSDSVLVFFLLLEGGILGALLIYVTSQLTLAFEKIAQLAQFVAFKELDDEEQKS